jgi:hypothetical protein
VFYFAIVMIGCLVYAFWMTVLLDSQSTPTSDALALTPLIELQQPPIMGFTSENQ